MIKISKVLSVELQESHGCEGCIGMDNPSICASITEVDDSCKISDSVSYKQHGKPINSIPEFVDVDGSILIVDKNFRLTPQCSYCCVNGNPNLCLKVASLTYPFDCIKDSFVFSHSMVSKKSVNNCSCVDEDGTQCFFADVNIDCLDIQEVFFGNYKYCIDNDVVFHNVNNLI